MTVWEAPTASRPVDAVVALPGSKSQTARALYLAAVSDAPTTIRGALDARDTRLFLSALEQMGASFDRQGGALRVTPMGERPKPAAIDCGLAGTVMRFLPPLAALSEGTTRFDGDAAARARPLAPLLDALEGMGARVHHEGGPGRLPFTIRGPLRTPLGAQCAVDASASSQFLSALLLVAPLIGDPLFVSAPGRVVSMPHVEMTVRALARSGIDIEEVDEAGAVRTWHVFPGRPSPGDTDIEPDLSNAGPFLAAAMVTGGRVRIPGWPRATSQPGDAWRTILGHMGARVELGDDGLTVEGPGAGNYPGIDADMSAVGELTPALAAICASASSPSRLSGIAHLRGHETDRLAALVAEITRIGGLARQTRDGIEIGALPAGGRLRPALLRAHADHRMATFAAVVGLAVPGIRLDDVGCTSKTLPGFPDLWADLLRRPGDRRDGRSPRLANSGPARTAGADSAGAVGPGPATGAEGRS